MTDQAKRRRAQSVTGVEPAPGDALATPAVERLPSRQPATVREIVALVDEGWQRFRALADGFPGERMDEPIGEGWTRKQMLSHIGAWHDMTHERLGKLIATGEPTPLTESEDAINARVARQAVGRTAGEVVKDMELSFNRLRRQIARLTDEQVAAHDSWAAHVIAGNTYEHYQEHADDVHRPPAASERSLRR